MPTPTKQTTRTTENGPAPKPGGILSRAVGVDQVKSRWVRIIVYGQNRVGKTHLACTFPKPLLLVTAEPVDTGGTDTVQNVPGVKVLKVVAEKDPAVERDIPLIRGTRELEELAKELRAGSPYQTVVLDTVTSLQDVVLQEICEWDQSPAQLNFGAVSGDQYRYRAERTKEVLRPFAGLSSNVVFLGKEKDHNPPKEERVNEKTGKVQPDMRPRFLRGIQQESFVSVDLGGATAGWLSDVCGCIGRLYFDKEIRATERNVNGKTVTTYAETGKFVRCLRTAYHPNFAGGLRSSTPDRVPECIEDPTYDKILKVIRGEKL